MVKLTSKATKEGYTKALEGIERKTLVHGEHTLLAEFRLKRGKTLSLHSHPEEQTGYLVSGRLILTIEGVDYNMSPGDSWVIPGGQEHSAKVLKNSVAVEVFSPVRKEYL